MCWIISCERAAPSKKPQCALAPAPTTNTVRVFSMTPPAIPSYLLRFVHDERFATSSPAPCGPSSGKLASTSMSSGSCCSVTDWHHLVTPRPSHRPAPEAHRHQPRRAERRHDGEAPEHGAEI